MALVLGLALSLAATTAGGATCPAALARGAMRHLRSVAVAAARCETSVGRGRLPIDTDCVTGPVTARPRAAAEARLRRTVAHACCGRDRRCGTPDDPAPPALGLPAVCPEIDAAGCAAPLASGGDAVACVICRDGAAAGELARVVGATSDPTARRCRAAIAGAMLRGLVPTGSPPAILPQVRRVVCAACGGADRDCEGGDDLPVGALGLPATCPALPLASGGTCTLSIGTLTDAVDCVACLAARTHGCLASLEEQEACDPPRPSCASGVVCTGDLDCPAGYACLDNGAAGTTRYCVGRVCSSDGACGGGGVCRQHCVRNGFAVECGERRCQCPGFGCAGAEQLCVDTGGLACRKICLQDSDCVAPFGFVCVNPGFGFGLCIGNLACQ